MQPQQELGPARLDEDDVIMVDPPQQSLGKRKWEDSGDQPSPRPTKRQTLSVDVPPHLEDDWILSALGEHEPSTPEDIIMASTPDSGVEEEPDQEVVNALAVIRNVS